MKKQVINIPSGVKFMSDIRMPDGSAFTLPHGVLAKQVTGCGGTTMALQDPLHRTIICSPRIALIKNKHEQMPHTLMVTGQTRNEEITTYLETSPLPKILTTFDSLKRLLRYIPDIRNGWHVVCDEFQFLITDASFKCDVELRTLQLLKDLPYVTYLSATPNFEMLSRLEYFQKIPYTELNWEGREQTVLLRVKTNRPVVAAQHVVSDYRAGRYFAMTTSDGQQVEAREVVIFLNSVKNIINIVKNTALRPEEVNIIVSNQAENRKAIRALGEGYGVGRIPLEGEPHKLVTLCTSTAYAGVDMMSETAATFVISDTTRGNTTVDVKNELVQIAGRQRLEKNPFRNIITLVYRGSVHDDSESDFLKHLRHKQEITRQEVNLYNSASVDPELKALLQKRLSRVNSVLNYADSYTCYSEEAGRFMCNELAALAEMNAYRIQREQYRSGMFLLRELEQTGMFSMKNGQLWTQFEDLVAESITVTTFKEKMRLYCDLRSRSELPFIFQRQRMERQMPSLREYYEVLGPERIKAFGYQESKMVGEYQLESHRSSLLPLVKEHFRHGLRLPTDEVKRRLSDIYQSIGLDRRAKVKDLHLLGFTTKRCKVTIDGRRVSGIETNVSETETTASETETKASETETKASEAETKASEAETKVSET